MSELTALPELMEQIALLTENQSTKLCASLSSDLKERLKVIDQMENTLFRCQEISDGIQCNLKCRDLRSQYCEQHRNKTVEPGKSNSGRILPATQSAVTTGTTNAGITNKRKKSQNIANLSINLDDYIRCKIIKLDNVQIGKPKQVCLIDDNRLIYNKKDFTILGHQNAETNEITWFTD